MMNPISNLERITREDFYLDIQARLTEYRNHLINGYDECIHTAREGEQGYLFISYNAEPFENFIPSSGIYIVECYDILESVVIAGISEVLKSTKSIKESTDYAEKMISQLQLIQEQAEDLALPNEDLQKYKSIVVAKLQNCINELESKYLFEKSKRTVATPKIKWKGKTHVLITLIYELWKGQNKGKRNNTIQILEAERKDIIKLLLDNFLDADGEPLKYHQVSTLLTPSREEERAAKDVRIEFDIPSHALKNID